MSQNFPEFAYYPTADEIDAFVEEIWQAAQAVPYHAEPLDDDGFTKLPGIRHVRGLQYVRFTPEGMSPFYGYWQPAPSQPAPLLVHVPGYGAEISVHPDLVAQGYNVLHVNPLGYLTPDGPDTDKLHHDMWPVFGETVFSYGKVGYRQWLINAIQAVTWARQQQAVLPDRLSFFGTSQGGGTSIILGSIYRDRGLRCVAADEPWMVHFPLCKAVPTEWFKDMLERFKTMDDPAPIWNALGYFDAFSHAQRLPVPVLLTAGGEDATCPPPTIQALFEKLPRTKAYVYLHDASHGYTQPFITLAAGWFRLYA